MLRISLEGAHFFFLGAAFFVDFAAGFAHLPQAISNLLSRHPSQIEVVIDLDDISRLLQYYRTDTSSSRARY
jgi:hypothetical protein